MAFEDYFHDLWFVEKIRQPDGTGGFEYVYAIGEVFKGKATKCTTNEQIIAGIRGIVGEQYTIGVPKDTPLQNTDVIMFVNEDKTRVFIRINSNSTYTPETSGQKDWKYMTGTLFSPDLRVVN